MNQNQEQISIELLYYIEQERQDNELVEKIIWNESVTAKVDKLIKSDRKVNVIGLYGTLASVKEYFRIKANCEKIYEDDAILKWQGRAILCWSYLIDTFYISFIALESYFLKDYFEETSDIIIYRFLRDLCQNIILLPSQKILDGWKNTNHHHYEDTGQQGLEFIIQNIEQAKLDLKEIKLTINQRSSNDFAPGLGNTRCMQITNCQPESIGLSEQFTEHIFLNLIRIQDFDIYNISLGQFSIEIQDKIRQVCRKYQENISDGINNIQNNFNFNVSNQVNVLNETELQSLYKELFHILRTTLDIENQQILDNGKLKVKLLIKLDQPEYLQIYEKIKNNYEDIEVNILEYKKQFESLQKEQHLHFQKQYEEFKQDLKIVLSKFELKDKFIDLSIYEFKYIIQKNNNQNGETIIEYQKNKQLKVSDIFQIQQNSYFRVAYYASYASQKKTIIILSNQIDNNIEYIWIDASQFKSILKLNQESSQEILFYHIYEPPILKLFIFKQKRIDIFEYNDDKEKILNEKTLINITEEKFVEICYLKYSNCFMLLSDNHNIFKWDIQTKDFLKLDDQLNQFRNNKYQHLISVGTGKYYILANQVQSDFFNFNNQMIGQASYSQYGLLKLNRFYLFSDEQDWFLVLIDNYKQITLQIKNLSTQEQITSNAEQKPQNKTNPFLDIIKGSVVKFGPAMNLLQMASTVITQNYVQPQIYYKIQSYFELVEFESTDDLVLCENIYQVLGTQIITSKLIFNLISRISIQLCTIEQNMLIPLNDGLKLKQPQFQNNQIRILEKIEQIQFGVLEQLINNHGSNIYIVSIMGQQSSGKSYLLNRIFGTRFGVSSARCTDGVWLGISKIEETIFILLDCEGLFSSRRTSDEETMLLAFLSSISDITILNQNLTFNRNLNELFQEFSKSVDQLRGEKLFKGKLLIAVRDVNQQEKEAASQELKKNIQMIQNNQSTGSFLSLLFNNKYIEFQICNFNEKKFDRTINELRKIFLNNAVNSKRWDNQKQMLRSIKILLVQIEVKDHRSLEDHELEYTAKIIQRKANDLWLNIKQNKIQDIDFTDTQNIFTKLMLFSLNYINPGISSLDHNHISNKRNEFIQQLLGKRLDDIIILIEDDFQSQSTLNKLKIEKLRSEIRQNLKEQSQSYEICLEKCSECFLSCTLRKNHIEPEQLQRLNYLKSTLSQLQYHIQDEENKIKSTLDVDKCQDQLQNYNQIYQKVQRKLNYLFQKSELEKEIEKAKKFFSIDDFNNEDFDKYLWQYFIGNDKDPNENVLDMINQQLIQNLDSAKEKYNVSYRDYEKNSQDHQPLKQEDFNQLNYNSLKDEYDNLIQLRNQIKIQVQQFKEEQEKLLKNKAQYLSEFNQLQASQNYKPEQQYPNQQHFEIIKQFEINLQYQESQIQNYQQQFIQDQDFFKQQINLMEFQQNIQKMKVQKLNKKAELEFMIKKLKNDINQIEYQIKHLYKNQQIEEQKFKIDKDNLNQQIKDQQEVIKLIEAQINEYPRIISQIADFSKNSSNQSQQQQKIISEIMNLLYPDYTKKSEKMQIASNSLRTNLLIMKLKQKIMNAENELAKLQLKKEKLKSQFLQLQQGVKILLSSSKTKKEQILSISNSAQMILGEAQNEQQKAIKTQQKYLYIINVNQEILKLQKKISEYTSSVEYAIQIDENQQQEVQSQILELENQIQLKLQIVKQKNEQENLQRQLNDLQLLLSKQHNCSRLNHQCDQYCQGCQNQVALCKLQAGHLIENKNHLCDDQKHFCKSRCQINDCTKQCQNIYNHGQEIEHDCLEKHQCQETCYFCSNKCEEDIKVKHTFHICSIKQCTQICYFGQNCSGQIKQCMNNCSYLHRQAHQNHICNKESHQCNFLCQKPGICQISSYSEIIKTWTTKSGCQFQYTVIKQNADKLQCEAIVDGGQISHNGFHFCKEEHMCGERCPECEAICTKVFGHQGKHKPQIHRNKDIQQFTALEAEFDQNLIIQNDEGIREFELGESCEPENCLGSCSRRSRAHYHLLKCKGGQLCAQVQLNKGGKKVANHQSQQYKFTNGTFDEILCENYWEFIGWEHPVENASRQQISLCNYYCSACGEHDKQYCNQEAWHTNSGRFLDHSFNCRQSHQNQIGVDIQFVIDTTSSMQQYIKMVKRTVKILMKKAQPYFQNNQQGILFSIVSYKDHCDKKLLQSINFTSHIEAIKFIKTLEANGGGDQPEAMLDGLDDGIKKSWRERTKKFMFLITDAPPHGNPKFHNIEELYPNGCPCGLTEDKVLPQIKKKGIELIVFKLNDSLNQTLEIFKKIIPKLVVLQQISNDEFIQRISSLVCRELVIREITIRQN